MCVSKCTVIPWNSTGVPRTTTIIAGSLLLAFFDLPETRTDMVSKRISQETFDEVVKENVEDFDMSPGDALADAINQFQKQGIDLSNVDLTGGIGRQEVLDALALLKHLAEEASNTTTVPSSSNQEEEEEGELIGVLEELQKLCARKYMLSDRNIMLMKEQGGVNSLHLLLNDKKFSRKVISSAIVFLTDLSTLSGKLL